MQHLKQWYQQMYAQITTLGSGCLGTSFAEVLSRLSIESNKSCECVFDYINNLQIQKLKKGVLFQDFSGVGLYALAFLLGKNWADGVIFQQYKALIVLPIEEMGLRGELDPSDYKSFLKILPGQDPAEIEAITQKDILIIVSGCSDKIRAHEQDEEQARKTRQIWFSAIKKHEFPFIVISNSPGVGFLRPQTSINISLKPYDLLIYHLRSKPAQNKAYISGKTLLQEAQDAVEQTFFVEKKEGSIKTMENWHAQVQGLLENNSLKHSKIKIPHVYPGLRGQELIKIFLATLLPDSEVTPAEDVRLSTPSEWFCAAITAAIGERNKACYRMGDYLMVRNLADNYIGAIPLDFDRPSSITEKVTTSLSKRTSTEFNDIITMIKTLIQDPLFDEFSSNEIMNKLKQLANDIKKTEKRAIEKQSANILKILIKTLAEEDPVNTRFNSVFNNSNKKEITYSRIQNQINAIHAQTNNMTDLARNLLKNNTLLEPRMALGLAAIMLGETKRYSLSFLITLCLFDLIEINPAEENFLWTQFFSHSRLVNRQEGTISFTDAILNDIAQVIGGLHPMTQGNSYNQVVAEKPTHGLHWVDFKCHIICLQWLALIIEKEQYLKPHLSATIATNREENIGVIHSFTVFDLDNNNAYHVLNPHGFDRFYRRLSSFDFMLMPSPPLRDIFPFSYAEIQHFMRDCSYTSNPIRIGLPSQHYNQHNKPLPNIMHLSFLGHLVRGLSLHPVKFLNHVDGKLTWREQVPEPQARLRQLHIVLRFDPDFFHVHYFIAKLYLNEIYNEKKAMEHLELFINKAPYRSELYCCALYLRIKCHAILGADKKLIDMANDYFSCYQDENDGDYWRVFGFRGMAYYNEGFLLEAFNDFTIYLKHLGDEETSINTTVTKIYPILAEIIANTYATIEQNEQADELVSSDDETEVLNDNHWSPWCSIL